MRINEEYEYDIDVVRSIIEKYEEWFKKDKYYKIFDALLETPEKAHMLLNFLFSIDVNPLDHIVVIPSNMFQQYTFPDKYKELVLPSSIQEIDNSAFDLSVLDSIDMSQIPLTYLPTRCFSYSSVLSVILPSNIKNIETLCFFQCADLEHIEFPDTLESIDETAFAKCENLKVLDLSNTKLIEISHNCFARCTGIDIVELPSSLKHIRAGAFFQSGLMYVNIPDGVTHIHTYAFQDCKYLETIVLPKSIELIDDNVFNGCDKLKEVNVVKGSYAEGWAREHLSHKGVKIYYM